MNNLYRRDISHRLIEIKTKINSHKTLTQNEIIEYSNLINYDLHRLDDEEIRSVVLALFQENIKYLDLNEGVFVSSFPGNYMQRIFELVVAGFFTNKFRLLDRDNDKTMEFSFVANNKRYALECVTRTAGQMDKFYLMLPFFDKYCQAAKIFFDGHTRWAKSHNILNSEWYFNIDLRWHYSLDEAERTKIINIFHDLGIDAERNIFKNLNDWIYINRYACLLYKYLIPDDLWAQFDNVNFPIGSLCGKSKSINEYALDSIVKLVIGKLKKPYFSSGEPMILAISLSTFAEFMYFEPMEGFIEYLRSNLCWKLNEAIKKECDKNSLNKNLRNLYAILVDTNSYNWFPAIAKERYGAIFTNETPNYYGIIYNTNTASHLKQYANERIFNFIIPFCIELPLGAEEESVEELTAVCIPQ
jgi:hypothetical protein